MIAVDSAPASPSTSHRDDAAHQIPALTGIRLPLALWVVGHHLTGPGRMLDPLVRMSPGVSHVMEFAWAALTVFFAISGFVLSRRYRMTVWTGPALRRYAAARFSRLYPVYFLSLIILFPIIREALQYNGDLGSFADRSALVFNYLLLLQGWSRPPVDWNTPAWSLSSEVFFYAMAPLLLMLARRVSTSRVLLTVALAFLLPILARLTMDAPIPKALLYFGDFVTGVAAAGVYDLLRQRGVRLARVGARLSMLTATGALGLVLARDAIPGFLLFDAGIRLASGLLVLGLACGGGWLARWLSTPVVLAGGGASYAIYILHVPLLWWYSRSALHDALPSVYAGLVYLGIVIGLSLGVWRWYERPVNDLLRRWYAGARRHEPSATSMPGVGYASPQNS